MPLMQRLKRLDDAVLPDASRWQSRYDAPCPLWLSPGGAFLGAVVGALSVRLAHSTSGVAPVVAAAVVLGYVVLALRWSRRHRRR